MRCFMFFGRRGYSTRTDMAGVDKTSEAEGTYGVKVYIHAKFPSKLKSDWSRKHLIRDTNGQIINFKPNRAQ